MKMKLHAELMFRTQTRFETEAQKNSDGQSIEFISSRE